MCIPSASWTGKIAAFVAERTKMWTRTRTRSKDWVDSNPAVGQETDGIRGEGGGKRGKERDSNQIHLIESAGSKLKFVV